MSKVKWIAGTVAMALSAFSMDLVVSPTSINWSDQGFVEFSVSNLTVGAEVELAAFVDLNGNGVVDGNDPLAAQFELEDGVTNAFGAVTFVDDNDGTENGIIAGSISFYGNGYIHTLGDYIWKATELDGSGNSVATHWANFLVTQPSSATWITGEVRDAVSLNTLAGAYVELEYFSDITGLSPSTWTDENGAFSIYLPNGVPSNEVAGVFATVAGYLSAAQTPDGDFLSLALLPNGLATGENNLVHPLFVAPSIPAYGLCDITGTVYLIEPADGGGVETNALPGVMVEIEYPSSFGEDDGDDDIFSFNISDTNGNFSLVFSEAEDEMDSALLSFDTSLLNLRGLISSPVEIILTGSTNGVALYCKPAEALVSGIVTDLTTTNPIVGIEVELISGSTDGGAYSLSNGTYEVGASTGTYGVQGEEDSLAQKCYVSNYEAGYCYIGDLVQGEVRSGQNLAVDKGVIISGHVYSESGSPIAGGDAILVEPSEDSWEYRNNDTTVAFDGHYNLLASKGTWNVRTENENGAWIDLYYTNCLIGSSAQATPIIATNAPISGIDFYLTEGTRLQGNVLAADALPPWEAQLSAFRLNGLGELELVGSGETDFDTGEFNFVVLSGSNIYLRVDSDGQQQTPDTWYGNVGSRNLSTSFLPVLGTIQSNLNIQILAGYQVKVTAQDQFTELDIPNITIAAFDAASNQYGSAVYQWDAWNIFVPTNTPLTFFVDAEGYEGEFITNTYSFANAGYLQYPANNYVQLEFILYHSSLDTDGDGLPDYLEDSIPDGIADTLDFSNLKNPDTDGDGAGDYQEYVAGTDARKYSSIFKITDTTPSDIGLTLRWSSVPGREYIVQHSSDLPGGSWTNIYTNVASNTETTYTPEASTPHDYYRIQVTAP